MAGESEVIFAFARIAGTVKAQRCWAGEIIDNVK